MWNRVSKYFNRNILCFTFGLALLTLGLYNIYEPLALAVSGLALMAIAILGKRRPDAD